MARLHGLFPLFLLLIRLHGAGAACAAGEFKCAIDIKIDGTAGETCIPLSWKSDDIPDCYDNSDEKSYTCNKPNDVQIICVSDGVCQTQTERNDGGALCGDLSDEWKKLGFKCVDPQTNIECCPCSNYVANSECSASGVCTCKTGYIGNARGNECTKTTIGDACSTDSDCNTFTQHGRCDSGTSKCTCEEQYYGVPGTRACNFRVLNDPCTTDLQCELGIVDSTCGPSAVCICSAGNYFYIRSKKCLKRRIGSPCDNNNDCLLAITNSECLRSVCSCRVGYRILQPDNCVPVAFGDSCTTDRHCGGVANAVCTEGGVCMCEEGYGFVFLTNTCEERVIGSVCSYNYDCAAIGNAVCEGGYCVCALGHNQDFRTCSGRRHGDSCDPEIPHQCISLGLGGTCAAETKSCNCLPGWDTSVTKKFCMGRYIGYSPCVSAVDCASIAYSSCINSICVCTRGTNDNITCEGPAPTYVDPNVTAAPVVSGDGGGLAGWAIALIVIAILLLLLLVCIVVKLVYDALKKRNPALYLRERTKTNLSRRLSTASASKVAPAPQPVHAVAVNGSSAKPGTPLPPDDMKQETKSMLDNLESKAETAPVIPLSTGHISSNGELEDVDSL